MDDATRLVYQKFGKIPLDGRTQNPTFLPFEILIQWIGSIAIYLDLGHNRKSDSKISLAAGLNFGIRSWLLIGKLIARKTKNDESRSLIFDI